MDKGCTEAVHTESTHTLGKLKATRFTGTPGDARQRHDEAPLVAPQTSCRDGWWDSVPGKLCPSDGRGAGGGGKQSRALGGIPAPRVGVINSGLLCWRYQP